MFKTQAMKSKSTEPLIRIVKKAEMPSNKVIILRTIAFVLAIVAGGLFMLIIGKNPFLVYATMVNGAFRSKEAMKAMVKIAIPLVITSLGVTIAFKMKFWNIGAEGQLIVGAICASYFALFCSDWPHFLLMFAAFIASLIGGGIWGIIPALFKARFNTNETLFTLMLNYIALYIIKYLELGPWRNPEAKGFVEIATFPKNAHIDKIFGVQAGWLVALILVFVIFVFLKYTKRGYEISVVGESQATARYAGINVKKVIISTMFISGAISGIAGMLQVLGSGSSPTLTTGVAGGVGFTAIIVAWLSQLNPFMILVVSIFFSILEKGGSVVQSTFDISAYASDILQGVILFFILGSEFFIRYSFVVRGGKSK